VYYKNIQDISTDGNYKFNDLFITIDIDWASDEVISYTLEKIKNKKIAATWFVTHETAILQDIRETPNQELGIHPNFNKLLDGDYSNGKNIDDVIDRIMNFVPEATSVRSHSMTQSSVIIDSFYKFNLTHDCNHFVPYHSHIELSPWRHWNGIIKVPYFWEDDIELLESGIFDIEKIKNYQGIKVFDFHPIHIFLDQNDMANYNKARPYFNDLSKLKKFKNPLGGGVELWFDKIISL